MAFLLVAYFFQDLLHKVWHWQAYSFWWKSLPFIHAAANPGKYLITISEAFIVFGLLFQKSRRITSQFALSGLIVIILYVIIASVSSHRIFLPYYLLGVHALWYYVLLTDLLLAWLMLVFIKLCPNFHS